MSVASIKIPIRVGSSKEKGGSPEDARQEVKPMEAVAVKERERNVVTPLNSGMSENRKLAIWLEKLVADSVQKGKPVSQMVSLTPALAEMLLNRNPVNRKINEAAVERYAYDIRGGRWTFNGEPIIVADSGELNDGQHRCAAVIEAGKPIDIVLIIGVPRDTRTTLDQGRTRTAGDYLSMEGHVNTNNLAAAANYAWQYRARGMLAQGSASRAMKSEVMRFVADNPALARSLSLFNVKQGRGLGGLSFLAFCHFVISGVGRPEDVDTFFIALTEGVNLGRGHPALYVRNRMMTLSNDRVQNAKAELIFRAWNAWRKGETMGKVWLQGGVLPVLER